MRPYDTYDIYLLSQAHDRAEELRAAWRTANFDAGTKRPLSGRSAGLARVTRSAAGRIFIELGRRVLPAETEPCA